MILGATTSICFSVTPSLYNRAAKMTDANTTSRITVDPAILVGKPVVRGTRLSVEFLIGLMADGWTEADIVSNYPGLTHEDLAACLAYARDVLAGERVYPRAAE
jgi:uncharacterized protein (DUF433 family)